MNIASKVSDSHTSRTSDVNTSSNMAMLVLLGEIEMNWEPENVQKVIANFFLLQEGPDPQTEPNRTKMPSCNDPVRQTDNLSKSAVPRHSNHAVSAFYRSV